MTWLFLLIALLSVITDITLNPISSNPIIISFRISNKDCAFRHLVGIICTTSLYFEQILLTMKAKALVAASQVLYADPTIVWL